MGHNFILIHGNLNSNFHQLTSCHDRFFVMICSIFIRHNKCRCIISWMVATTPAASAVSTCQYSISCDVLTHKPPQSKVIPHPIKTTVLSKTAKWGRLKVHMNLCLCILFSFVFSPILWHELSNGLVQK